MQPVLASTSRMRTIQRCTMSFSRGRPLGNCIAGTNTSARKRRPNSSITAFCSASREPMRENTPLLDSPIRSATACKVMASSPSADARSIPAPMMAARVSSLFCVLASMEGILARPCEITNDRLGVVPCLRHSKHCVHLQTMPIPQIRLYQDWLRNTRGLSFASYDELWRWSVTDLTGFWQSIWDYFNLQSPTPHSSVLSEEKMPGARWFEGAQFNYVHQVFRH